MKMISTLAAGAALSAMVATGALASDLNGRGSSKDDFGSVNKVDFNGLYVGLGAGGQFANVEVGGVFDGIGADGLVGEAVAGFDVRRGSFVFGPRVIGAVTNVNTEIAGFDLGNIDAYVNLGGRVGVVFNRTLIYAHAGYEILWLSSDIPALDAAFDDADTNAATVGLGLETMLTGNLSFVVEGTYVHGLDDAEDGEAGRGVARLNMRF